MKRMLLALALMTMALSGCGTFSQRASFIAFFNVSVAADDFEVTRRIWLHNRITGIDTIAVEGLCSFWPEPDYLRAVCKVGNEYSQHTFGLSEYVTFSVEQIDPIAVDTNRRDR